MSFQEQCRIVQAFRDAEQLGIEGASRIIVAADASAPRGLKPLSIIANALSQLTSAPISTVSCSPPSRRQQRHAEIELEGQFTSIAIRALGKGCEPSNAFL